MDRDPMQLALSTHIVMDVIVSHLKLTDLLSCRKVSKFWSKAASSALRKRSTMMKTVSNEEELMELEECMKQSSDFPFSGYNHRCQMSIARELEFFQKYGDRFTLFRTNLNFFHGMHHVAHFVKHLPRLSILEVVPFHAIFTFFSELPTAPEVLKLPSVRIIRFLDPCFQLRTEEDLCEVITAASPSVRIECLDATPEILKAIKSAGRLRAVSFMKFHEEADDFRNKRATQGADRYQNTSRTEIDQLLSTESPSLTKLDFYGGGCLSLKGLEKILMSSQHTLKELHLDGSWLSKYSWETFPVLTKLTKLSLNVANDFFHGSLFHGRHGNKFPILKELYLRFQGDYEDGNVEAGCASGLYVVPTVTVLELEGTVDKYGMEQLTKSFPNGIDNLRICKFKIKQPLEDYIKMYLAKSNWH